MEQNLVNDLSEIFSPGLDRATLDPLIRNLDMICSSNVGMVFLKTRNDKGEILNYQRTKYFSLVSTAREKPVIFAGAIERKPDNKQIAAVRFRNQNTLLRSVPKHLQFPYYKPNWTCVVIDKSTADILLELMRAEVNSYLSNLSSPKSNDSHKTTNSDNPFPYLIIPFIGIGVGLYGFFNITDGGLGLLALGFIIFVIGALLMPKGSGDHVSFKEARYNLYGIGEPPKNKINLGNLSGRSDNHVTEDALVRCPRCSSTQITAQKRGFKVGRAVGVGIATGAIGGLIAGATGKNKVIITCLKCGHEWRP